MEYSGVQAEYSGVQAEYVKYGGVPEFHLFPLGFLSESIKGLIYLSLNDSLVHDEV